MISIKPVARLLEYWDGVIGGSLFGDDGVDAGDDYWVPLAASTLRTAIVQCGGTEALDVDDVLQRTLAALAALRMIDVQAWASAGPGSPEVALTSSLMQRLGVPQRTAETACAALAIVADNWRRRVGDVRPLVRQNMTQMTAGFNVLVPADQLRGLGLSDPHRIVGDWAATLLGTPPPDALSAESLQFCGKFGLQSSQLAQVADRLDRVPVRVDAVVRVFMETFCAGCDPTRRPVCVDAAAEAGAAVVCPLLAI